MDAVLSRRCYKRWPRDHGHKDCAKRLGCSGRIATKRGIRKSAYTGRMKVPPCIKEPYMTPKEREAVSEVLKRRVGEIRKMFDPKVSSYSKSVRVLDHSGSEVKTAPPEEAKVEVDDVQQAMLTQIMLLAQDLDVAFDERIFVEAVRVAAEEA